MEYLLQHFLILWMFCAYISIYKIYPKSLIASLCFFYLAVSSLITGQYPQFFFEHYPAAAKANIMALGNNSLLFALAIFGIVFSIKRENLDRMLSFLSVTAFVSSLIAIISWYLGLPVYGLMLNTSMEGTFIALIIPTILFKKDNLAIVTKYPALAIIPILAAILTTSSIGIGGIFLGMMSFFFLSRKSILSPFRKKLIIFTAISVFLAGYAYVGNKIFSDSARFICWDWSFNWWKYNANQALGTGIGSYWSIGPWIQLDSIRTVCMNSLSTAAECQAAKYKYQFTNYYTFMHNDWLQLLFEGGLVGFLLAILAFVKSLFGSFKEPWLFTSIVVYGAVSFINMPSHYVLSALLGLTLFRMAVEKKQSSSL